MGDHQHTTRFQRFSWCWHYRYSVDDWGKFLKYSLHTPSFNLHIFGRSCFNLTSPRPFLVQLCYRFLLIAVTASQRHMLGCIRPRTILLPPTSLLPSSPPLAQFTRSQSCPVFPCVRYARGLVSVPGELVRKLLDCYYLMALFFSIPISCFRDCRTLTQWSL